MQTTQSPKAGERTQHTPGPWKSREARNDTFIIEAPGSKSGLITQVATIYETSVMVDQPERREYDASLISAAPDLLSALRSTNCDTDHERMFCNCPLADGLRPDKDHATFCVDARHAISKAEGTSI